MIELKLTTNGKAQKLILAYLQENVSEVLAEKINNGVLIEKDGKRLLNKKDLTTFIAYAAEQAKKTIAEQQRKGEQAVCVHDDDVMSWAIHYFEEDSIEGTLYNEDGSEYKPAPKTTQKSTAKTVPAPAPKQKDNPQMSLFGLLDTANATPTPKDKTSGNNGEELDKDDEEPSPEEIAEIHREIAEQEEKIAPKKGSSMYQHYIGMQKHYPDSIIAYRLGDFYEVLGNKAVEIADKFDLTITSRDVGLDERIPMIGFPYHAADVYFSKIVDKGYRITIVENLGELRTIEPQRKQTVDLDTGEVITEPSKDEDEPFSLSSFDKETMILLYELLDGKMNLQ